ncbi:MAG TPA: PA0069 family radical SAM protein [Gemmatimonadota bacterium]
MSSPRNPAPRGRGASWNPPNRFERLHVEPDLADLEEAGDLELPAPRTQYFSDRTQSVIAHNDSPDVGFDAGINPYRGCQHGCAYCHLGDTSVLTADGQARPIGDLKTGDEIYGTIRRQRGRYYVRTRVLAHWDTRKLAHRIMLEDGTELVASGDHRFLTERGWKFVTGAGCGRNCRPRLTLKNKLVGVGALPRHQLVSADYRLGYLSGMIRGDGLLRRYERGSGVRHHFRVALIDDDGLDRTAAYLRDFGLETRRFVFQNATGTRKEIRAISANNPDAFERVLGLIEWPRAATAEWSRGFLAGIFDAEGGYSGGILRIFNTEPTIIQETRWALHRFGFSSVLEVQPGTRKPLLIARLTGGLRQHLRFMHLVDPAIRRKRDIAGQALESSAPLGVVSIEPIGMRTLYDITTGTGDFIANGVVSHNCFARPSHEYLGLSAGLDFETKILVKENAPELLRRELSSPRWEPQVIALSGNTDCYQPIERRLGITRRCLEVLVEFRNPVGVITKNHLVTRDADLLAELAAVDAAAVNVSVTTLDPDLARTMEPRTSTPARRLTAIEKLSRAGVPVGVLVAPVIPGLTDHELPAILQAAADAGACFAGYVPIKLPHAVAPLFERWLDERYPEKKSKVLGRIREMRGGRLNDPRFGYRQRGEGPIAAAIGSLFAAGCRRAGLSTRGPELSTAAFRRPAGAAASQPDLFS